MTASIEEIRAQTRVRWRRWYAKPENRKKASEQRSRLWRENAEFRERAILNQRIRRAKARLAKLAAQAETNPNP